MKEFLKPVLKTIYDNPYANLTTLRLKLFLNSGLKEIMNILLMILNYSGSVTRFWNI